MMLALFVPGFPARSTWLTVTWQVAPLLRFRVTDAPPHAPVVPFTVAGEPEIAQAPLPLTRLAVTVTDRVSLVA